jgi:hypothetical protein
MWFSQYAYISVSLNAIYQLAFVVENQRVPCEVGNEFIYDVWKGTGFRRA